MHRQQEKYYLCCLGREAPPVARQELIDDSSLLDAINDRPTKRVRSIRSSIHRNFVDDAPVLALEDAPSSEEGEPEELGDISQKSKAAMKGIVDKGLAHYWGSFKFTAVERIIVSGPKAGHTQFQWQCICPYHADPGDPPGTHCTRTVSYDKKAESDGVLRVLRHWCVAGRRCKTRAIKGERPHKEVKNKKASELSDADLLKQLRVGSLAKEWIEAGDTPSDSSSTDSSSSSSSSSESE